MRSSSWLSHRASSRWACRSHWYASCISIFAIVLVVAAASAARADDDLPGRVGRIADFAGQLYLSTQDRPDDWTAIGINYPVTSGDNLWVSGDGRAEVDYGGGQFRLAGDTNLNVARLDDRQLTLFIAKGRLIVRARLLDTDDVARIDTPNTQIALTRPGLYRIDVSPDGASTTVSVREGESLVGLASGAQQALPGQTVTVSGTEPLAANIRNGSGADGFDTWSANRDRRYERARATPYVSRQMVGYAELDEYGSWDDNPAYGAVWYPTAVASDWAPYQDGYWTSVGGWGLAWVDAAPWGYAPSHYGRWVRVKGRWGWCPGAYAARPHWAPALVGWYGGAGWGVTANGGAPVYGWVPLGWGDTYTPWWRGCSQACWNRYNRPFAADPVNARARYSNMNVPGAVTAVPGATLVGRKPVGTTRVPLPASQLASAPLLATAPSVTPGPIAAPVFRPGERGTPTPASALYSNARRNSVLATPVPRPAAPVAASGAAPASAASGASGALPPSVTRIRPAPALTAPTQAVDTPATATRGQPIPPPAAATQDAQTSRRMAQPTTLAPVPGPREATVRSGPVGASGASLPAPSSAVPAARPAPAGAITVPATGIALPPAPAMVAPVARTLSAPPQGQPSAAVVVLPAPPAPIVVAPADRAGAKGGSDADSARGAKAGDRAPLVVPGPPR